MFFNAGLAFVSLVDSLSERVKIEKQPEGWAVIIDNEVYTWAETEDSAMDFALRLIDLGI